MATTVTVSPGSAPLQANGATLLLSASVLDQFEESMPGAAVSWSSSSPSVAVVGSITGLVTSGEPGMATITATSGGATGTSQITVSPPPVASVDIDGPSRAKVGETYAYTATASLADGTVVVRLATWSLAEPDMGIITADGLLTPLNPGTITVQVTIDGMLWGRFNLTCPQEWYHLEC